MTRSKKLASIFTSAGFIATGLTASSAYAAAPTSTVQTAIEEVLVTARRREESLQEVPIAISAFGSAELEERGVENLKDLNAVAPNLAVYGTLGNAEAEANFRVRGMPGVAVYVDGVNQPQTTGLLTMGMVEVDRIEVLRGPQGTLFGNTSLGGAISYVTRPPGDTFGARIRGTIGSYDRRDISAAIDLPLSDTFKAKFTAASQQQEGFLKSRTSNARYGDVNDELYRADFLWKPADSFSLRYNYEVSAVDRQGFARQIGAVGDPRVIVSNVIAANGTVTQRTLNTNGAAQAYANIGLPYNQLTQVSGYPGGAVGEWETNVGLQGPGLVNDVDRHTLDINWNINDTFSLHSITGYKELTSRSLSDLDGNAQTNILGTYNAFRNYTLGEELQLLGNHGRVNWVLGAYYEQQYNRTVVGLRAIPDFTCDQWSAADRAARGISATDAASCASRRATAMGSGPSPSNGWIDVTAFSSGVANRDLLSINRPESRAVFGDLTWRLTDQFTVSAGLRYSKDESTSVNGIPMQAVMQGLSLNSYFGDVLAVPAVLPPERKNPDYSALTKRLNLQYQWTPELMTYVSYADGYRPGTTQVNELYGVFAFLLSSLPPSISGINDIAPVVTTPEQSVKNYEIGMRADWLGGALRTNVTAFYTDWRDVPMTRFAAIGWWDTGGPPTADSQMDVTGDGIVDPQVFAYGIAVTAAKAEASGVELETLWRATENLRFGLNVGYLKTEYKEVGTAGQGLVPAIRKGVPFAAAPEYTANVSGQYSFGFSGGAALVPRIDYTYTDDYTLIETSQAQTIQKGFGLLNARLTYDSGANWSASLQGSNLTNEHYFNSGIYSIGEQINFETVGSPREWGLTFDFRFD